MFSTDNRGGWAGLAIAAAIVTPAALAAPAFASTVTGPAGPASPVHASHSPLPPTITVGSNPISIAYAAGTHSAYVANDGSVSTIDTRTNTQTAEFKTGWHGQTSIAVAQGGQQVLVGTINSPNLKIVSPVAQAVVGTVKIGTGAYGMSVAGAGPSQTAYVAQLRPQRVSIVNTATDKLIKQIHLPEAAQFAGTSPDQSQVWIGSAYDGTIWVVDTKTHSLSRTISVDKAGPVSGVAFGPDGNRAWVSGLGGVDVVNVHTGAVVKYLSDQNLFPGAVKNFTLDMGDIAVTPNGRYAMVLNQTFPNTPVRGSVTVIDTTTFKVVNRMELGMEPVRFAIAGSKTYVANYADDTVSYFPTPH
jgi:YVTN family beta-propeller protein